MLLLAVASVIAQQVPEIPQLPSLSPMPGLDLPTTTTSFQFNPIFFLFGGVIMGFLAMAIWRAKGGSPVVGFLWGFLLGLIGVIVVAVARVPGTRKVGMVPTAQTGAWQEMQAQQGLQRPCPHCQTAMPAELSACPQCHQPSEPWLRRNGVLVTRNDGKDWWFNEQTNTWLPQRINKFCPYCRADMLPDQAVCPECGQTSSVLVEPV